MGRGPLSHPGLAPTDKVGVSPPPRAGALPIKVNALSIVCAGRASLLIASGGRKLGRPGAAHPKAGRGMERHLGRDQAVA
jgi:hypothetical protein